MTLNEKESNCDLSDQLSLLERIERVTKRGDQDAVLEEIEFERKQIERKLYQNPSLLGSDDL